MNDYDQTAQYCSRQREQQLRALLRAEFGTRKYRITRDRPHKFATVHVCGPMPNSNVTGWYLLGSVADAWARYENFGDDAHAAIDRITED